jgi:TonB family protein
LKVNGRDGVTVSQGLRLLDGGRTQQQQAPQAPHVEEIPVPAPPAPPQQRLVRVIRREPEVRKFKAPALLPTTAPKAGNAPEGPPVIDLHLASSAPVLSGLWQPLDVPPSPAKRRVVAGYIPPQILQKVLPQTATLRNMVRAGDMVQVLATIGAEGNVTGVRLLGPKAVSPVVLQAVVQAARQWRFTPAMLRGSPIPSEYRISFQFAQ